MGLTCANGNARRSGKNAKGETRPPGPSGLAKTTDAWKTAPGDRRFEPLVDPVARGEWTVQGFRNP